MEKRPTLYLDMDGVLADFNTAAQKLIQATDKDAARAAETGRWTESQWALIAEQSRFYLDLPKMPQADQLVELAIRFRDNLDYDIKILSAIPHDNDMPDAFHDKIDWINKHYGEHGFRVHFGPYSHDKQHHCANSDDILVDDRTSNCVQWRSRGGLAVQVLPNKYDQALSELETIFHQLMMLSLI